jgi:hypothetical protein
MACDRPGRASSGLGISSFLRENIHIAGLLAGVFVIAASKK